MKNNQLKFDSFSDLELLNKSLIYLNSLVPFLPFSRLKHHCMGAMASIFELSFYLSSHHLNYYGNNEK